MTTNDDHHRPAVPGARWGAALTSDLTVGQQIAVKDHIRQARAGLKPGLRSNLWASVQIYELEAGLKLGARGDRALRAAIDLIRDTGWLRGERGFVLGGYVMAREPDSRARAIDWQQVAGHVDRMPGTESAKAALRVAVSLAGGAAVDFHDQLQMLGREDRRAVRRAVKFASRA
ncbi:hypothetical protein GCM10028801_44910 [Nocardioides maradonensis]